ncbi:hypothetical protein T05_12644 [Trichinella murrelli]|uniref:Uncharacterized protein n=1 Tax=Trichinella murrelli TaxID=144512 RepID=A0A0V0T7Q1_9BILA|nr:hypothetical protein T05_12644 [Trichinella murrelli]
MEKENEVRCSHNTVLHQPTHHIPYCFCEFIIHFLKVFLLNREFSEYNLPDVRSSGNESGLYDVDSSWPTEYWVVKKEIAAQPPMSGTIKTDNLAIFVGDPNHH